MRLSIAAAAFAFGLSLAACHSKVEDVPLANQKIYFSDKFFDVKAMSEAVPDALVDEIAVAGTPDEARDKLAQWQGLTEQPLLYAPSVGVPPERLQANVAHMFEIFGSKP